MEHIKLSFGIIGIILIGLLSINCNNITNDNKGGVYLNGTFGRTIVSSYTYNDRLVFTTTTFSSTDRNGPFLSGSYKYDGAILTLTISGINHNKYANFSGGILTISGDGGYSEFFNGSWILK